MDRVGLQEKGSEGSSPGMEEEERRGNGGRRKWQRGLSPTGEDALREQYRAVSAMVRRH